MRPRKVVSLIMLVAFALLLVTGTVLFIVPHGRVAYWTGWTLWGLTKTEWTDLHLGVGLLFLVGGALHMYFNWRPITSYLRDRARGVVFFSRESLAAAVACLAVVLGTHFGAPPISWVLALGESIKDEAGVRYGEPPYGHAELSTLATVAARMDLDLQDALQQLSDAGFVVESAAQTLEQIARENRVTPQEIYQAMAPPPGETATLPLLPPPGTGRRRLGDLCSAYHLDITQALQALAAHGIEATAGTSLKAISERSETNVHQVYEIIRLAATRQPGS